MKNAVKYFLKCSIAGVVSIALLCLFSLIYYNPPIATEQPDNITNYKFISNSNWSYMLEGFGFGKTDNLGYNNAYYNDCVAPDIVLVGSSHMEALQVPQDANCTYLLNKMFDEDDVDYNNFKCVNLGISAHSFEVSISNFKNIANKFDKSKYIIIETSNVEFTSDVLDDIMAGKFHSPIEKKGFIAESAQKIPFIRLMYKKWNESVINKKSQSTVAGSENQSQNDENDINVYVDKMNAILGEIYAISEEKGIEPVILLHERFWEDRDGNITTEMNASYKEAFIKCCEDNGVKVIDVAPEIIKAYNENFEYSYGFANSTPGEGHLNKTGHRIIAQTIYNKINEMENAK